MGESSLLWVGTASAGRIQVGSATFATLAELADHLRARQDPWGGLVRCAAALGIALHAMQSASAGSRDTNAALSEADALLHDLPVRGVVARMRRCAALHVDILTGRELAARLVLEARRFQREQTDAVARAIAEAAALIPGSGPLLLTSPGGPGCDLGEGLLTGTVLAARQPGRPATDLLVVGPTILADDAVAYLADHDLAAQVIPDAIALTTARSKPLAAVLVRCLGENGFADPAAAALADNAAKRGILVIGISLLREDEDPPAGLLPLPSRARLVVMTAARSS